jgi:type II secretory pathway pseudopilin PulG
MIHLAKQKNNIKKNSGGYMLVEILVSLTIFAFVAVTSTAALLAVMDANTKAQSLKSVMDNLSVSIENISRTVVTGTDYKCIDGPTDGGSIDNAVCTTGKAGISFVPQDSTDPINDRILYYFAPDANGNGTIYRKRGSAAAVELSAPEVNILDFTFFIIGATTTPGQARVFMAVNGRAGPDNFTQTRFSIQTTISQREREAD